jgi:hypothetical protein
MGTKGRKNVTEKGGWMKVSEIVEGGGEKRDLETQEVGDRDVWLLDNQHKSVNVQGNR